MKPGAGEIIGEITASVLTDLKLPFVSYPCDLFLSNKHASIKPAAEQSGSFSFLYKYKYNLGLATQKPS